MDDVLQAEMSGVDFVGGMPALHALVARWEPTMLDVGRLAYASASRE